jgi:hypothetical protein
MIAVHGFIEKLKRMVESEIPNMLNIMALLLPYLSAIIPQGICPIV